MTKQIEVTFEIGIDGRSGKYTIEARGPNRIRVDPHPFVWKPSRVQQESIALLHSEPKRISLEQLAGLGQEMFQSVFTPTIAIAFGKMQQNLKSDSGVRIRLRITPQELSRLPWELMHDGHDFLALRSNYPLVRALGDTRLSRRTAVRGALKILYVWSEPQDLPALNLAGPAIEIDKLLAGNKRLRFDILPHATHDQLRAALLKDYHIMCFAGHGSEEYIYFEKNGGHEAISAQSLIRDLEGKPTRLVFLAACKTAGMPLEELAGFAPSTLTR